MMETFRSTHSNTFPLIGTYILTHSDTSTHTYLHTHTQSFCRSSCSLSLEPVDRRWSVCLMCNMSTSTILIWSGYVALAALPLTQPLRHHQQEKLCCLPLWSESTPDEGSQRGALTADIDGPRLTSRLAFCFVLATLSSVRSNIRDIWWKHPPFCVICIALYGSLASLRKWLVARLA